MKNRLEKRNQNTREELEKRLNSFEEEIKHWKDYDYIITRKFLKPASKQIENIILNNKNLLHFLINFCNFIINIWTDIARPTFCINF